MNFIGVRALFALVFLLWASTSWANTYWVATGGNDSNSCGSVSGANDPGRYRRTIRGGLACLGAGDTLLIKDGTYQEATLKNVIPGGTSWSNPVVIKAQNSRKAIFKPDTSGILLDIRGKRFVRIQGLVIDGNFSTTSEAIKLSDAASDIEFVDVEVKNIDTASSETAGSGIYVGTGSVRVVLKDCSFHDIRGPSSGPGKHGAYWKGNFGLIESCEFYNIQGWGIQFYSGDRTGGNNNVLRYSVFRNIGRKNPARAGAMTLATGKENKVYGNLVYGNAKDGIRVVVGPQEIYNNTVYGNPGRGLHILGSGVVAKNNIVFGNGSNIIDEGAGNALLSNLTTDPLFVDAANGDFRLKSGSPAITMGAGAHGSAGGTSGTISLPATPSNLQAAPH